MNERDAKVSKVPFLTSLNKNSMLKQTLFKHKTNARSKGKTFFLGQQTEKVTCRIPPENAAEMDFASNGELKA